MEGLEEKGAQGKKELPFLTSPKNIQVKIIYLDANLLRQPIYTGTHLDSNTERSIF